MLKKFAIGFGLIFGVFLFANQVQAIDSKCWEEKKCEEARAGFGGVPGEGFYWGKDAWETCGVAKNGGFNAAKVKLGFCLPAGQSITKISFGGKQSFANFGEFIQYIYRYGMWLAGILAVAFIVISGLQWAASGGNSDMIGSAKNRITGAVTGLILLALSYTILGTINPYLVQLRLPQTWMINYIGMATPFCRDAPDTKISLFTKSDTALAEKEKIKSNKLAEIESKGLFTQTYKDAACGYEYFVDGTSGQTCQGSICSAGDTCSPLYVNKANGASKAEKIKQVSCVSGQIILHMFISPDLFTQFKQITLNDSTLAKIFVDKLNTDGSWSDHKIWISPVCQEVGNSGSQIKTEKFFIDNLKSQAWGDNQGELGYFDDIPRALNKTPADEYLIHIGKLNTNVTGECFLGTTFGTGNIVKANLVGYLLALELDQELDGDDGRLYIGYSATEKKLVYGSSATININDDYIPLDVIKDGFFGSLEITNKTITDIIDESD